MDRTFSKEDSGALFNNRKKTSQNAPDMNGNITLSPKLVQYLNEKMARGEPLSLDISGWRKRSGQGMEFLSLSIKEKWVPQQGQQMYAPNAYGAPPNSYPTPPYAQPSVYAPAQVAQGYQPAIPRPHMPPPQGGGRPYPAQQPAQQRPVLDDEIPF